MRGWARGTPARSRRGGSASPESRASTYVGSRWRQTPEVVVLTAVGEAPLGRPRGDRDLYFNWGTTGPGVTKLAAAILTDVIGRVPPTQVCESFAHDLLRPLPWKEFTLPATDVHLWLSERGLRTKSWHRRA